MKEIIVDSTTHIKHSNISAQLSSKYNSWIEIDTHAILHNLASYKKIVAPTLLAPVIKSNAYGHGIGLIATLCEQSNYVDALCVVDINEALFLRSLGIKKQVIVLSILKGEIEEAILQNIQLVVHDISMARHLNELGKKLEKKIEIHIKIDTGLSRLGFLAGQAFEIIKLVHSFHFLVLTGVFTHFSDSESSDQSFTHEQIARMNKLIEELDSHGISIPLRHASCSAAITANLDSHYSMSRVGIGMYGLWPSSDNKIMTNKYYPSFVLKPALTWKTSVIQLKEVPAGSFVGYSCTRKVECQSLIATIPVGYWDGYDRAYSNNGMVFIKNELRSVIGRVAMNMTMIDVTGMDVHTGDEVILLGDYPGVTADDLASRCDTINYEIVTRINPLLPRIAI